MPNALEKLNQAEAILHSLTGPNGADALDDWQVQTLLVLCTSLVQDAVAPIVALLSQCGGDNTQHAA